MATGKETEKQLIITADDLGYCTEFNHGIVECYQAGAITRSSLMVNGVAAEEACRMAKEAGLPMGLHFNVTEGHPLTEAPSLVKVNGVMQAGFGLLEKTRSGHIDLTEVRAEMRAQLKRFIELTGGPPLYVDGHHHSHIMPGIREVFTEEMITSGFLETRLPLEHKIEECRWLDQDTMTVIRNLCTESVAARRLFEGKGLRLPDLFVGGTVIGNYMSPRRLQERLSATYNSLQSSAGGASAVSCELMVHVGYQCAGVGGCGDGAHEFSRSPDRRHEMEQLMNADILQWYRDTGIKLVASVS